MSLFQFNIQVDNKQAKDCAIKSVAANRAIDITVYKRLEEILPRLEDLGTYFLISDGRWSSYQVLNYYLDQMPAADVWISTYGINERAMRNLINRKESGNINNLYLLLSDELRRIKPQESQIAMSLATRFKFYPSHAKIIVAKNSTHSWAFVSSMNLNRNNKLESGVLTTDKAVADFYCDFIDKIICS